MPAVIDFAKTFGLDQLDEHPRGTIFADGVHDDAPGLCKHLSGHPVYWPDGTRFGGRLVQRTLVIDSPVDVSHAFGDLVIERCTVEAPRGMEVFMVDGPITSFVKIVHTNFERWR